MKEPSIIARSKKMLEAVAVADRVAPTDTTVMIMGESGTGKELIARRIHCRSRRSKHEFVEVNCGAIPVNLVESILFGHERGSFTGADKMQVGLFEMAHKGTIFLDEVGTLPLDTQVKLLRVLQGREVRRVGSQTTIPIDVRVIAATNQVLRQEAENGRFRKDLYFRLEVVRIEMPPLRERVEEIPYLVEFFSKRLHTERELPLRRFNAEAISLLQTQWWLGNVRELENVVERLVVLTVGDVVTGKDIELGIDKVVAVEFRNQSLDDVKKIHIRRVLMETCGNKMQAARILGCNVKTLYNMLRKYELGKIGMH